MEKQISRCVNDINRLWKTTEHCRRAKEYQKEKLDNIFKQLEVLVYSLKRSET